jgi:hypothetical protein
VSEKCISYEKKIAILTQQCQHVERERRSRFTIVKVLTNQLTVLKNENVSIRNLIATTLKDFQSMWTHAIMLKDKQIEV